MTLEEFGVMIASLNIPAIFGPYNNAQATPYISYYAIEKNVIYADGRVIYGEDWIELRLVTESRDLSLERAVEQLLSDNGIAYDYPDFAFDQKQRIHTATYAFLLQPTSGHVPHLELMEYDADVKVNKTIPLHVASVYPLDAAITWMTSDASTATVDASGIVTGVSTGTCSIVALIVAGGVTYTDACTITIYEEED